MTSAKVWNAKSSDSSTMEWADWQPRSDSTGDCRSLDLSFTVGAATLGHAMTACEKWTITKYSEAGKFANELSYVLGRSGTSREVGYGVEVYVPVGGWPRWTLYAQVKAG